jgi:hypothetical protein
MPACSRLAFAQSLVDAILMTSFRACPIRSEEREPRPGWQQVVGDRSGRVQGWALNVGVRYVLHVVMVT